MRSTAAAKKVIAIKSEAAAAQKAIETLTETQAAQAMWVYYRDNKAQLISDIKDYRAHILKNLMAGIAVEQVFAPFVKPLEPAKPVRRRAA